MPTKDPIAAARREAKARARKGGITHQQALDAVAHESGHANWSAMTGSSAATAKPVATTVATETIARPEAMDETRRAAIRSMTRLNDWIGSAMREAPTRAIEGYVSRDRMHHAIREVPLNAQTIAQAVDPDHGPWPDAKRLTVRCPLHEDRNGSLVISGKGRDIGMRCMAGCDDAAVHEHALARLSDAAVRAAAFMKANDARKVFEGFGRGTEGVGGMGGVYRLTDGSRHELDTLACRMLAEGYPVWIHGKVPPSLYSVETALRVALAGRYPITVEQPADMRQGTWQATIRVFKGYDVIVQWRKGGPYGVSTTFEHEFKGTSDERHPSIRAVVARALKLVESHETTDPERLAEEKARVAREMAHRAANTGVDAEGWGWWAGPNEDEFTWGGPYTSKEYAKGEANGHCGERGEAFFVVFAKADMSMEPVDGELVPFVDSRKPILCRSQ